MKEVGGGKLVCGEKEVRHFITIAHIFTFRGCLRLKGLEALLGASGYVGIG